MENKQITLLKNRLSEVEKLHNRLTAIVVHLYHDNMHMKKQMHNQESINVSSSNDNDEIDKLVVENNTDSNDRANRILEELKKAHH